MELILQNVEKSYGDKKALRGVSARLNPGIYALLGPNGAGKSTLMNILVQNLKADGGAVLADGEDIARQGNAYRARIGYMPQQQALPGYFTAERFLYYIAALKGLSQAEADGQIPELLKLTNLWDRRREKLGSFSGGMKQRALIAQAVLGKPDLLIMDEPTAGLDPKERIRIRNLISRISEGRIVLIATHVVSDVECIADHILFIRQGQLVETLRPEELGARLQGKVYEWMTDAAQADAWLDDFRVSALIQESEGVRVRMVSDDPPPENAVFAPPHLEDMYLYLFGKDA